MNLDALLRIGARVTGAEQIGQLQNKLRSVEAATTSLTSRAGMLGGALGALAPVATVGGLTALIGKTIQTGDEMFDLAQRTGVSVEALAKFRKAAVTSGTDIDTVAKNLAKLSKGMYEAAQTGKGATAEALATLGISARDAAGNLKSADQVTLEIANRFKAMPDGVEKTALAMQLFGRSGAEMVPLLNMGGDAIDRLKVKMNSAFAEKADAYSDKLASLSGKVGGLAAGLTVALLPALDLITTGITAVVDVFNNLPGPIQAVVGVVALLAVGLTALAPILGGLVLVGGALQGLAIGATIAGWLGAIGPLIATVGTFMAAVTLWPLALGVALVTITGLIFAFRDDIGGVLVAIGKAVYGAVDGVNKAIRGGITSAWDWLRGRFDALVGWVGSMVTAAGGALGKLGDAVKAPFIQAAESIRGVLRTITSAVVGAVNGVIFQINRAVQAANNMAAALRLPQLPQLPTLAVPQFATGAYVTGPTAAVFGEAGPEYAIPADRMASASAAYLSGARGAAVLSGRAAAPASAAAPSVTIQTGPVMQQPDGGQWVSVDELPQILSAYGSAIIGQLQTPAGRMALRGA
jgi:hypothetical protein